MQEFSINKLKFILDDHAKSLTCIVGYDSLGLLMNYKAGNFNYFNVIIMLFYVKQSIKL